jgi:hypothetical protein
MEAVIRLNDDPRVEGRRDVLVSFAISSAAIRGSIRERWSVSRRVSTQGWERNTGGFLMWRNATLVEVERNTGDFLMWRNATLVMRRKDAMVRISSEIRRE